MGQIPSIPGEKQKTDRKTPAVFSFHNVARCLDRRHWPLCLKKMHTVATRVSYRLLRCVVLTCWLLIHALCISREGGFTMKKLSVASCPVLLSVLLQLSIFPIRLCWWMSILLMTLCRCHGSVWLCPDQGASPDSAWSSIQPIWIELTRHIKSQCSFREILLAQFWCHRQKKKKKIIHQYKGWHIITENLQNSYKYCMAIEKKNLISIWHKGQKQL